MNRFKIWYNRHSKLIWSTIGVIVGIIIIIQLIDHYYEEENQKELERAQTNTETTNTNIYNDINLDDTNSTVTGEGISSQQKEELTYIDDFIEYCNEKNLQEAYNLLSEDCKEQLYPTLEDFETSYYDTVFNGETKTVGVENWVNDIYKVTISDNYLSSGVYSTENNIQDYITIIEEDDESIKLNINSYIGKKEINKSKESDNIIIEVEESHTFMDYQIYKIKVENNSENTILLDDDISIDAMYLEDENGNKYSAYSHELNDAEITVSPNETKEIEIKYYNKYSSSKKIEKVVFSRMILNNETYTTYQNKSLYREYGSFEIEI